MYYTWGIGCTVRSCLHQILTRIWIFPPGLENNHKLKWYSDNFPTTPHMSGWLENYQSNTSVYLCSPIQGRRSKKVEKNNRDNWSPTLDNKQELLPRIGYEDTFKCLSDIFLTNLTYMIKLKIFGTTFEWGVCQNQGKKFKVPL